MERTYRKILAENVGNEVVVKIADSADLKGKVAETNDDGFFIFIDDPTLSLSDRVRGEGGALRLFVDYSHVRGVGLFDWDLSKTDPFGR
jgi:hypothetical protein